MALLAVIPNAEETYERVEDLARRLNLQLGEKVLFSSDLKMVNLALGLQGHQCRHPCAFCEWIKGKNKHDYPIRTFEKMRGDFERFQHESGKKKDVKLYNNCIRPASSLFPKTEKVIDFVALPELHLLLGVVNKLFSELKTIDTRVANTWSSTNLHLRPAEWSSQFAGNDCKKLLHNTSKLRSIVCNLPQNQRRKKEKICLVADAFESFQILVHSCFGNTLSDTWESDLINFRDSYVATGASISPKVHIVFGHLTYFVKKFGALGVYSEQAAESIHHDFNREFQKYNVKDRAHPKYAENLLKAVCAHNGKS